MIPRNIHGTAQLSAWRGGVSLRLPQAVDKIQTMTASPAPQPAAASKPADAWVSIGAAAQAVLAKLKVAHDPRA
jgi:hypothetical protein